MFAYLDLSQVTIVINSFSPVQEVTTEPERDYQNSTTKFKFRTLSRPVPFFCLSRFLNCPRRGTDFPPSTTVIENECFFLLVEKEQWKRVEEGFN